MSQERLYVTNQEQIEAGFRAAVMEILRGRTVAEAFDVWGLDDEVDLSIALAVAWKRATAGMRILAIGGPPHTLDFWVATFAEMNLAVSEELLSDLLPLIAQEAGGIALGDLSELPGTPASLFAALMMLTAAFVHLLGELGCTEEEIFAGLVYGVHGSGPVRMPDAARAVVALRAV